MKRYSFYCKALFFLGFTLFLPLCVGAAPGDLVSPQRYLQLAQSYGVFTGSAQSEGSSASAYEVRGVINGIGVGGDQYQLLLRTPEGGSTSVVGRGEAPPLRIDEKVRILLVTENQPKEGVIGAYIRAVVLETDLLQYLEERSRKNASSSKGKAASLKGSVKSQRTGARTRSSSTSRGFVSRTGALTPAEIFSAYRRTVAYFNPTLSAQELDAITSAILNASIRYGVDARLVMAVIAVESGFRPEATSRAGAMGLGQLMPGTASSLGVADAYDPVQNVFGAVKYLRTLLDRHKSKNWWKQLALALASYNAGPGAVKRHGGIPPYRETQAYIQKVAAWYRIFTGG